MVAPASALPPDPDRGTNSADYWLALRTQVQRERRAQGLPDLPDLGGHELRALASLLSPVTPPQTRPLEPHVLRSAEAERPDLDDEAAEQ